MTRMMASVHTVEEAELAVARGADIIDVNGPRDLIPKVAAVAGSRCISVTAGDAGMEARVVAENVREIDRQPVDYIRMPVFTGPNAAAWIAELAGVASRAKLIAAFSADAGPDLSLLPLLGGSGFAGAMLGMRPGSSGRLLDTIGIPGILGFVEACHAAGLLAGLAGRLEMPDIPRLLVLAPDVLAFCQELRDPAGATGALDPARVRKVRELIPTDPSPGMHDEAVGHAPASHRDAPVDLVFVNDLVLPVFIGAYAREREAPQNVRFAVTASVMRNERTPEDIRDVFSYDLITDGIRMLTGSGHIALVETLAERIAAMVLRHPRVTKVVVRVEKLETGSGAVGVQIERTSSPAGGDRSRIP